MLDTLPDHARFGAKRRYDIHTGIDLYCNHGDAVFAFEDGIVVAIEDFTGPDAESPWWNPTKAVLVEGKSGVICYGEVEPLVEVGQTVAKGDKIATVLTVLKNDKGKPMTMLHMELHKPGTTKTSWWKLDEPMPESLMNVERLFCENMA